MPNPGRRARQTAESGRRSVTRAFLRGLRFFANAIIAAVVLFCTLLLLIRFLIFPNIGDFREHIATGLASTLGAPVTIGALDAGWDGWNPRLRVEDFAIHDRDAAGAPPALQFPRVDLVVAWTSLAVFDLRLKELSIERPQLSVRRDREGRLHVAGLTIDPDANNDDTGVTDWLLRQREIVVRDALLIWDDELRNSPQLVLDNVQFRLERSFIGHRFRLVGEPPAELAAPIDFRGEVTGSAFKDWRGAKGRFYVRLDYADVGLWREWVPALRPVEAGQGALRMWFDFADGQPTDVVADVELSGVRTRFANDLPKLELAHLAGRLQWKREGLNRELLGRGVSFRLRDGLTQDPFELRLAVRRTVDDTIVGGTLSFDRLDVAPLTTLAAHLPLPDRWRDELAKLELHGDVSGGKLAWDGPPEELKEFSGSGSFRQLGIAATAAAAAAAPGVSGVSGSFAFDQAKGELKLDSRRMQVALPGVFPESLLLESASGHVGWARTDGEWKLKFSDMRFTSGRTSGTAKGSWQPSAEGPGTIELVSGLDRIEAQELWRYLPLTLDANLRDWLKSGIKAGTASDLRVTLSGDLAGYPFADARHGKFQASFKFAGGTLAYADHWPELTDVEGVARFEGAGMIIDAQSARVSGARLGPVTAQIANLGAQFPLLNIVGKATGSTAQFLAYMDASPVSGWIGHPFAGAQTVGDGELSLSIDLELGSDKDPRLAGDFQFVDNQLSLSGIPKLSRMNGKVEFTGDSVQANDLTAEALGGALRADVASGAEGLRVAAQGTTDLTTLRGIWEVPLLAQVSGTTNWRFVSSQRKDQSDWTFESSLKGANLVFPAPLGKTADASAPLKISRRNVPGKQREDFVTIDYRGNLRAIAHRVHGKDGATIDRAVVLLGPESAKAVDANRPGLWIQGQIEDLDVDEWLAFGATQKPREEAAGSDGGLTLAGVDLATTRTDIFGRALHDLKVAATRGENGWRLRLDGREVKGTAVWSGPTTALPHGQLISRLTRFQTPGPAELRPRQGTSAPEEKGGEVWPKLDIVADALVSRGHDLGRFEFLAQPVGTDWKITKLALTNPAGRIDASGWWRSAKNLQTTELDVDLAVTDAGLFLQQFGYPVAVRKAPTKIHGKFEWAGAPNDFDYPTLSGIFRMETGAGQFTKIDPGIGKLLGVLSLQALPRRITLDFSDVFSEGFAFESITGDFRVQRGQMHTDNLKLVGPAANVNISGEVDLAAERQRLNVHVQPALSTSVSAGATVLLLANPLIGAAVGAGALLAQNILDNPIGKMFSFDYLVTGGWSDPQVERVTTRPGLGDTLPGQEYSTR